jgi:Mg-chelatase subunit ChlD
MFKLKIFNRISPFFCLALALTFLPKLGMSQDENEEAVVDPALEAIQALEEKESVEAVSDPGSIPELEQIEFGETIEIAPVDEAEDSTTDTSVIKDVVLVLDNSGSMKKNDPKFLTSIAVTEFINSLDEATRVAIIIFDQDVRVAVPLTEVLPDTRDSILQSLEQINYKGLFTDSPAAIERAIYDLKQNGRTDAKKLIIFMTDGIVDTGNANRDLEKAKWLKEDLAADAADSEIKIFGIAFTEDADFELIQSLAQNTDGEYYRALQPEDLNGVFERVHTIINKQPEPEPVIETPVVPDMAPTPQVVEPPPPVIIEVPVQATPAMTEEEEMRSTIILVALFVLIIAVIVMVLMLIKGARGRGAKEEVAQEAFLNDINGYTSKNSYKLGNKPTMLGRVAGKDTDHLDYIVIPETTIGRRHSLIEYKDFAYWIVDQGSINGTFVNDQLVTSETRLKHGDKIRLHRCEFEFAMPDDADAGMTVISNTVLASQPASNIEDVTIARESSGIQVDEDALDEPDFDITGAFDDDEEDSETPTEIKGTTSGGSDETIMLDDDNAFDLDDDATIRPEDLNDDT